MTSPAPRTGRRSIADWISDLTTILHGHHRACRLLYSVSGGQSNAVARKRICIPTRVLERPLSVQRPIIRATCFGEWIHVRRDFSSEHDGAKPPLGYFPSGTK